VMDKEEHRGALGGEDLREELIDYQRDKRSFIS